jgi:ATP-dependent DNA helicase
MDFAKNIRSSLKNHTCQLLRELKKYNTANYLLLTGTPLQNNLLELWNFLNFILPKVFDSVLEFKEWFKFDDELQSKNWDTFQSRKQDELVASLHFILQLFLLRRLKADGIGIRFMFSLKLDKLFLPKKREYYIYAPLTYTQHRLYMRIVNRRFGEMSNPTKTRKDTNTTTLTDGYETINSTPRETIDDLGTLQDNSISPLIDHKKVRKVVSSSVSVFELPTRLLKLAMQLRKVVNHPDLFNTELWDQYENYNPTNEIISSSEKMQILNQMLTPFNRK